jgi:hypothetical protein
MPREVPCVFVRARFVREVIASSSEEGSRRKLAANRRLPISRTGCVEAATRRRRERVGVASGGNVSGQGLNTEAGFEERREEGAEGLEGRGTEEGSEGGSLGLDKG